MKKSVKINLLVIAMVVAFGGFALAETEVQTIKVVVDLDDSGSAEVNVNGDVHIFNLEDLADGEEQTFTAGENTVVVRRVGDDIKIFLDGNEVGSGLPGGGDLTWIGEGEDGEMNIFDHEALGGHKVMIFKTEDGEGPEGETVIIERIHEMMGEDGEMNIEVITSMLGGEHGVIKVEKGSHEGGAIFVKSMAHHSGVRYFCEEDGTEIKMSRDKVTQDAYMCPVCGREMSKMEAPQVKVMRIGTVVDEIAN